MLYKAKSLTMPSIEQLARKKVMAVHIKESIKPELAAELAVKILLQGYHGYTNAPSIGRIGTAFYETERDVNRLASYFDQASNHQADLRDRCAPLLSPIDLLRCTLDEAWPAGAMLETLYGRKMYVGLSRVVEPGVTFLAHHDIFAKDAQIVSWRTVYRPNWHATSISKCQKTGEVCKFGIGRWRRPNLMRCVRPATALIRATWVKQKFT